MAILRNLVATLGYVEFGYEKLDLGRRKGGDEDSMVRWVPFGG